MNSFAKCCTVKLRKAGGSIVGLPYRAFPLRYVETLGSLRLLSLLIGIYHPLCGRSSARIWQSRAVAARKAHNLEVAGPSPASATRAAVSPVTLSTAASAAMQAAVPTQGGHLRGEVGTLSLHQCESTTFSKIFFRGREPELVPRADMHTKLCYQRYAHVVAGSYKSERLAAATSETESILSELIMPR